MSDRLEEIKEDFKSEWSSDAGNSEWWFDKVRDALKWLIAEVERLRPGSWQETFTSGLSNEQEQEVQSLQSKLATVEKERDELKDKLELDVKLERNVFTCREGEEIFHYKVKPGNRQGDVEFKTITRINIIGYRILPLEDFKTLEASLAASEKKVGELEIKEIRIIKTGANSVTQLWINGKKR